MEQGANEMRSDLASTAQKESRTETDAIRAHSSLLDFVIIASELHLAAARASLYDRMAGGSLHERIGRRKEMGIGPKMAL